MARAGVFPHQPGVLANQAYTETVYVNTEPTIHKQNARNQYHTHPNAHASRNATRVDVLTNLRCFDGGLAIELSEQIVQQLG